MQITPIQNRSTQNFQANKIFKFPTKEVLECSTGIFSKETLDKPSGVFKIFKELYNLKSKDLKDFHTIPLGFHLYAMSSGAIIKANNPQIAKYSNAIEKLPQNIQNDQINRITQKLGSQINITIDDKIKSYNIANGKVNFTKK